MEGTLNPAALHIECRDIDIYFRTYTWHVYVPPPPAPVPEPASRKSHSRLKLLVGILLLLLLPKTANIPQHNPKLTSQCSQTPEVDGTMCQKFRILLNKQVGAVPWVRGAVPYVLERLGVFGPGTWFRPFWIKPNICNSHKAQALNPTPQTLHPRP